MWAQQQRLLRDDDDAEIHNFIDHIHAVVYIRALVSQERMFATNMVWSTPRMVMDYSYYDIKTQTFHFQR